MLAVTLAALALQVQQVPVRVSASLSDDDIAVGESTLLVIEIETGNGAPDRVQLPAIPDGLDIVGTEDVTETRAAFPGGRTRVSRRTLVLLAHRAGQYTIPPVRVETGGRVWESSALSLLVRASPSAGGELQESRIEVALEPDRAYVGQQILLEATASFSRGLRARQTRPATYQAPSPPGFWIHDLPDPLTIGLRTIDGSVYETQTFRRAYFPLVAGTFRMPPAQLLFEFRRGFAGSTETRALVSDSPSIVVLPVPRANQPASFRGAVGRYTVRARVSPMQLRAGEAATLIVEVTGTGNIKALPSPLLSPLDGLDVHPPTEETTVTVTADRVGGTKRFTWVIVPERAGTHVVPAVEYAFFDPDRVRYEVARTDSFALEVGEAGLWVPAARLAPVAGAPSFAASALRSPLFAIAQLVPLLLIAGAWAVRRGRPFERRARRTRLSALARLALMKRSAEESDAGFHADLAAIIRTSLVERLGASGSLQDALRAAVQDGGLPADVAGTLLDVLQAVDRARFSGRAPDRAERRVWLERTEAALRSLERRRIDRAVPLLLLALASAGHGQERAPPYQRGVALNARGEHAAAAAAFRDHLLTRPRDANAWHALGNTLYQSNRPGEAVHAWLRAVRLDPQHGRARTNLARTVGETAAPFLPARFALSWTHVAWLIAAGWWVSGAAVAVALWSGRRWRLALAPFAAAATLGLAAAAVRSAVRPAAVSLRDATLLADPALKAEAIDVIPEGSIVTVVEHRGDWLRVRIDRREGWAEAVLLGEV